MGGNRPVQLVTLRLQWMPKFEAVLPGKKAALFFQLGRRIGLLIGLQLASMIPMLKQAPGRVSALRSTRRRCPNPE